MNSVSRFKEHFEVVLLDQNSGTPLDQFYYPLQNHTANSIYSSSISSSYKCATPDDDLLQQRQQRQQRQSLSTTIDSLSLTIATASSSNSSSTSSYSFLKYNSSENKDHLKRNVPRLKPRRPKIKLDSFLNQISTTNSISDWCRKQKLKLFGVRPLV